MTRSCRTQGSSLVLYAVARLQWPLPPDWLQCQLLASRELLRTLSSAAPGAVQGLSNTLCALVWSHQHADSPVVQPWLDSFWPASHRLLARFPARELCITLWALGRLCARPPRRWACALALVSVASLSSFSTRELTVVAWAFARMQMHMPADLLFAWLSRMHACMRAGELPPHELALGLWSMARVDGAKLPRTWLVSVLALVRHDLPAFPPEALSVLACALARLGAMPEPCWWGSFYAAAARASCEMTAQQVANVCRALAAMRVAPPSEWVRLMAARFARMLPHARDLEIASACWALAALQYRPDAAWLYRLHRELRCDGRRWGPVEAAQVCVALAQWRVALTAPWQEAVWKLAAPVLLQKGPASSKTTRVLVVHCMLLVLNSAACSGRWQQGDEQHGMTSVGAGTAAGMGGPESYPCQHRAGELGRSRHMPLTPEEQGNRLHEQQRSHPRTASHACSGDMLLAAARQGITTERQPVRRVGAPCPGSTHRPARVSAGDQGASSHPVTWPGTPSGCTPGGCERVDAKPSGVGPFTPPEAPHLPHPRDCDDRSHTRARTVLAHTRAQGCDAARPAEATGGPASRALVTRLGGSGARQADETSGQGSSSGLLVWPGGDAARQRGEFVRLLLWRGVEVLPTLYADDQSVFLKFAAYVRRCCGRR